MNNPKKQHYVPQVYLKNFAYAKNNTNSFYINVYSKAPKKIYISNIENTAAERDFYTLSNAEDKYVLEKHYANNVEPILAKILKKLHEQGNNPLIQDKSVILNKEDKRELVLSIILQWMRGKQTREYERLLYDSLLPEVITDTKKNFAPLSKKHNQLINSFGDNYNYFKEIATSAIFNEKSLQKYYSILMNRSFVLFKIIGEGSFVTSDNPIMIIDKTSCDATPFKNGIVYANTLIYYPISPKLLIAAYHPNLYGGMWNRLDCRISFIDSNENCKFICMHNKKQKEQCYNYVYAQSRKTLELL